MSRRPLCSTIPAPSTPRFNSASFDFGAREEIACKVLASRTFASPSPRGVLNGPLQGVPRWPDLSKFAQCSVTNVRGHVGPTWQFRCLNRRACVLRAAPSGRSPAKGVLHLRFYRTNNALTLENLFFSSCVTAFTQMFGLQRSNVVNGQGFKLHFVETHIVLVPTGSCCLKVVSLYYWDRTQQSAALS